MDILDVGLRVEHGQFQMQIVQSKTSASITRFSCQSFPPTKMSSCLHTHFQYPGESDLFLPEIFFGMTSQHKVLSVGIQTFVNIQLYICM